VKLHTLATRYYFRCSNVAYSVTSATDLARIKRDVRVEREELELERMIGRDELFYCHFDCADIYGSRNDAAAACHRQVEGSAAVKPFRTANKKALLTSLRLK
jgi:hypothetical protein